jgi:hypothetical protein
MEILEAVSLIQAPKSGKWFARLIEADKQGSSAYYSKASLERSVDKFKAGTHMYSNHLSMTEKEERPEGDVNNLIGVLEGDGVMRPDGIYAPVKIYSDKRAWIEERANDIGLSIRAEGKVSESNGRKELEEITHVHSVDVVTRAGAGGKFVSIMESARSTNDSEAEISEAQKEDNTLEFPKELAESLDTLAKDMRTLMEAIAEDRQAKADAEAEALAEAAKANEPKAPTAAEIAEALVEAGLAPKARARVLAAVEGGADLKESIQGEKDIAAEILAEAAKNSGSGFVSEEKQVSESEREAKIVANVYG